MSEENKAIVRRLVEAVFCHGGNPNVIDELLAPTFVRHDPSSEAGEVTRQSDEVVLQGEAWCYTLSPYSEPHPSPADI